MVLGWKLSWDPTLKMNSVMYQTWHMEPTLEGLPYFEQGKGFQAQQLKVPSMSQSINM
jgi:hypothetical protein